ANCTCVSSGKEEPAVNFISYSPSRHLRCIADLHPIFSVLFSGSQSRHLRFSIAELHRRRRIETATTLRSSLMLVPMEIHGIAVQLLF
ncbi:hypothetical protein Dimus_033872, partial [Dionaea muscipula]